VPAEHVQILYFRQVLLVQGNLCQDGATSSRVVRQLSLCSDLFRSRSSVMRDIFDYI
jgi:hypothetical protein